jgi:hypothetical protein
LSPTEAARAAIQHFVADAQREQWAFLLVMPMASVSYQAMEFLLDERRRFHHREQQASQEHPFVPLIGRGLAATRLIDQERQVG